MLIPRSCAACGRRGPSPCPACAASLRPAPSLPPPAGVDVLRAAFAYEGAGRELVARLKYRNARATLPWLRRRLAVVASGAEVDVVTWAPTTAVRRRNRGFDQAQLLARAVAGELGVPCRRLLIRRTGPAQTGRTVAERRSGPVIEPRGEAPARVLLVDDVCTSGATLTAAAVALRRAGAVHVFAVTAARAARHSP